MAELGCNVNLCNLICQCPILVTFTFFKNICNALGQINQPPFSF